jgi:hypothetical protein
VVELVLGKELENGQWTDRLYVISELAAGPLREPMVQMIQLFRPLKMVTHMISPDIFPYEWF